MFNESRLKVWRALFHIHEISNLWEAFVKANDGSIGTKFDPADGTHKLQTNIAMPVNIALASSDAIRCLRTALDYLVCALARSGGMADNKVRFPFNDKRKVLAASFEPGIEVSPGQKKARRAGEICALAQRFPELQTLILDGIQPYSADDGATPLGDLIWRIVTADNTDKHRMITPVAQYSYVRTVTEHGGGVDCVFLGFAPHENPIKFLGPPEMKTETTATVNIVFPPHTSRIAGKPVVSALVEARNFVAEVIELFEAKFGANC